jgi:hypothetical protein
MQYNVNVSGGAQQLKPPKLLEELAKSASYSTVDPDGTLRFLTPCEYNILNERSDNNYNDKKDLFYFIRRTDCYKNYRAVIRSFTNRGTRQIEYHGSDGCVWEESFGKLRSRSLRWTRISSCNETQIKSQARKGVPRYFVSDPIWMKYNNPNTNLRLDPRRNGVSAGRQYSPQRNGQSTGRRTAPQTPFPGQNDFFENDNPIQRGHSGPMGPMRQLRFISPQKPASPQRPANVAKTASPQRPANLAKPASLAKPVSGVGLVMNAMNDQTEMGKVNGDFVNDAALWLAVLYQLRNLSNSQKKKVVQSLSCPIVLEKMKNKYMIHTGKSAPNGIFDIKELNRWGVFDDKNYDIYMLQCISAQLEVITNSLVNGDHEGWLDSLDLKYRKTFRDIKNLKLYRHKRTESETTKEKDVSDVQRAKLLHSLTKYALE